MTESCAVWISMCLREWIPPQTHTIMHRWNRPRRWNKKKNRHTQRRVDTYTRKEIPFRYRRCRIYTQSHAPAEGKNRMDRLKMYAHNTPSHPLDLRIQKEYINKRATSTIQDKNVSSNQRTYPEERCTQPTSLSTSFRVLNNNISNYVKKESLARLYLSHFPRH